MWKQITGLEVSSFDVLKNVDCYIILSKHLSNYRLITNGFKRFYRPTRPIQGSVSLKLSAKTDLNMIWFDLTNSGFKTDPENAVGQNPDPRAIWVFHE